jgi:outer membrane lipoprotein-sorting protein
MSWLRAVPSLAIAMSIAGCATQSAAPTAPALKEPRRTSLDEALAAYDSYCDGARSFSGSGDMELSDAGAGKTRKMGVRLLAARPGRLYLKASVLVVTALEVVSDGTQFWFQVPSKKTIWTGPTDAPHRAEGSDATPYYALRPTDLTAALLPESLSPGAGEALLFEADRETVSLAVGDGATGRGTVRRRVWLDRESLRPSRWRTYDERGDLLSEASIGGWSDSAPHRATVSRPREGYVASFVFDRAEMNVSVPDRAFVPRTPEGYTVMRVGG